MHPRFSPVSRRWALGGIGAAMILPHAGLAADLAEMSGRAFGTTWRLLAPRDRDLGRLDRGINEMFAEIDRIFSPWRPDSTISRFNAMPKGQTIRAPQLADVANAALAIARQSGGALDPTVGPLVARWGFGPIERGGAPDWRGITPTVDTLGKDRNDLTLDLCGIAKGWALDRAADLAEASGIDSFLMELGGEFIARGRHPSGRDWQVAVDIPLAAADVLPTLRLPSGAAIATSGIWAQRYDAMGRTYSHIIDPSTLLPISGTIRSVTVLSEDAMTADGWATALCAAGSGAGMDLASSLGIAALFLIEEARALRQIGTDAIREFLL